MTLVDTETGEVVEVLSFEDARDILNRLKVVAENMCSLVEQLYFGRAWIPLGYESWDDLCSKELRFLLVALPKEHTIGSLRQAGMSNRAVASAVGVSEATVPAEGRRSQTQRRRPAGRSSPTTTGSPQTRNRWPSTGTATCRTRSRVCQDLLDRLTQESR
ncbi:MAG TPA: hypothetical protein VGB14_06110 [Acidimicrobiales bacterium]|jgi:hypothetical protein